MQKSVARGLFVLYTALLVWAILFKFNFSLSSIRPVRELTWIPFYYPDVPAGDLPWMEALLNLLAFVPFGYLAARVWRGRVAILCGFGLSLLVESLQYALAIGATDITDLITNTLGGVLGAALAVLVARLVEMRRS